MYRAAVAVIVWEYDDGTHDCQHVDTVDEERDLFDGLVAEGVWTRVYSQPGRWDDSLLCWMPDWDCEPRKYWERTQG